MPGGAARRRGSRARVGSAARHGAFRRRVCSARRGRTPRLGVLRVSRAVHAFNRRHHCRHCGFVLCKRCGREGASSRAGVRPNPQRVCRGARAAATGGAFEPAEESAAYAAAAAAVGARNAAVYGNGAYANGNGDGGGVSGVRRRARRSGGRANRDVPGRGNRARVPGYPHGVRRGPRFPCRTCGRSCRAGGGRFGFHTAHTAGEGANQA